MIQALCNFLERRFLVMSGLVVQRKDERKERKERPSEKVLDCCGHHIPCGEQRSRNPCDVEGQSDSLGQIY
jgi:hypothetical protein